MFGLCLDVGVFLLPFFLGQAQFLIIFVGQTPFLLMFVANPITPTSHIVFWCMISVLSHIYYIYIYVYYKYIYIHTHYTYIFIYIYTLYIHMFCMFKKKALFFSMVSYPPKATLPPSSAAGRRKSSTARVAMYATMGCSTGSGSLGWPSQDRNGINILMG